MAQPKFFRTAISKLGYEAKAPSDKQSEKIVSTPPSKIRIPTGAPKFFVDAIEKAKSSHRPVIIDFWATWCAACLQMKSETLEHPDVAKALLAFEVIFVDLDKYPALGEAYGVVAIPDVFFIDHAGTIIDRLQNFEPPKAFLARIQKVLNQPLNRDIGDR